MNNKKMKVRPHISAPDDWMSDDHIKNADNIIHLSCPVCKNTTIFGDEMLVSNGKVVERLSCDNNHYWHETWERTSIKIYENEEMKKENK
jgi:predicted nucleic-acid-binding Zn-ribbon protein